MSRSTLPAAYELKEHRLDMLRGKLCSGLLRTLPQNAEHALNPQTCQEKMLNILAIHYMTDFWDTNLLVSDARNLISRTLYLKQIKGTIEAIHLVLASFGIVATIKEGMNLDKADGAYAANGIYYAGGGLWQGFVLYIETPVSVLRAQLFKKMLVRYTPARSKLFALVFHSLGIADGTYISNGAYTAGIIGEAYV